MLARPESRDETKWGIFAAHFWGEFIGQRHEAGERLFTFTRLPESQWKSARTTNAVERLHEEFKRRIKTQTVLPSAETAAMLFWAEVVQRFHRAEGSVEGPPEGLLASGQITLRKIDG